jgi:cytochrome c-type biogenesis protein CcmH/NrfG
MAAKLNDLAEKLASNRSNYDLLNQYVDLAVEMKDIKSAVRQLTLFAMHLEEEGKSTQAMDCYKYILDLDPNNQMAKRSLNS